MLAIGSSAGAQDMGQLGVSQAVKAVMADSNSRPAAALATPAVATVQATSAVLQPAVAQSAILRPVVAQPAVAQPAARVAANAAAPIATEAAWLYKNGWQLYALVDKYSAGAALDEQSSCLATAVYFEARGESLEGQLAVARVVMNRAASGRYPPDWCSVVKQPAQFSFVRHGEFPWVDTGSTAWAHAQAIARLAVANVVPSVEPDVLWYHANYVAPSWGHRLNLAERIGAHIFYRA
jgi:N-acetylmuramoyl-L-alanine amidase